MKSLLALGVVLLIVGAMIAIGAPELRPVGGALLICGAGLVIYSFLPRRSRSLSRRGAYSWEDDEKPGGAREIYTATPGEVAPRTRPQPQEPGFVSPSPGAIPPIRQQASGGEPEYTAGHGDVPPPREREKPVAEYSPPAGEMQQSDATEAPVPMPGYPTDSLPGADSDLPPMAPPPPR